MLIHPLLQGIDLLMAHRKGTLQGSRMLYHFAVGITMKNRLIAFRD